MKKFVFSKGLSLAQRRSSDRRAQKSRRLRLENLEDRALLSASPNDPDASLVVESAQFETDDFGPIALGMENDAEAAPAAPTNVQVGEFDVVTGQQTVTWDLVDGADSYVFQFRSGANGAWTTLTAKGRVVIGEDGGSALVGNKYAGAKYQYRVQAVNEFGASEFTETELASPKAALDSVSISGACELGAQLDATLSAGGPYAKNLSATYQWYRGAGEDWTAIAGATKATYATTIDDVGSYLRVVATGKGDVYTGTVEATTPDVITDEIAPLAPTNVQVGEFDVVTGEIYITWDLAERADSYVVQYRNGANGAWNALPKSRVAVSEDGGLALLANKYAGVKYQCRVQSVNAFGSSDFVETELIVPTAELDSVSINADCEAYVPITATLAAAGPYAKSISATYQWYRGDGDNWDAIIGATKASYTPTVEDVGSYLRVEATAKGDVYSGVVETQTADVIANGPIPVAPDYTISGDFDVTKGVQTLTWSAVDGADSYEVQFRNTLNGEDWSALPQSRIKEVGGVFTATASAKYAGKTYQYRVRSVNIYGQSDWNTSEPVDIATGLTAVTLNDGEEIKMGDTLSTELAVGGKYAVRIRGTYQWYRSADGETWEAIELATRDTYVPTGKDFGKYLMVKATGKAPYYYDAVSDSTGTLVVKGVDTPSTVVTTLDDTVDNDGVISLREAIQYAADYPELGSTITFADYLQGGTIVLGGSELALTETITIDASALAMEDGAPGIVIDANHSSRVFHVSGADTTATLLGLAIKGGKLVSSGAGTQAIKYSGAGVLVETGAATLVGCSVEGNSAYQGGGIYIDNANVAIVDTLIESNSADTVGGGVYFNRGELTMTNDVVLANSAETMGGGLYLFNSKATLTNCTVTGNRATLYAIGGVYTASSATLYNTIVALNYNQDVQGSIKGSNNLINAAPGFVVAPTYSTSEETPATERGKITNLDAVDLHLASGSAAIDAGGERDDLPEFDFEGKPRIIGDHVDIGAYEYEAPEPIANSLDDIFADLDFVEEL